MTDLSPINVIVPTTPLVFVIPLTLVISNKFSFGIETANGMTLKFDVVDDMTKEVEGIDGEG